MKKIFTLSSLMLIVFFAAAQTIPNPGFENWETVGTYENPVSWSTPNPFTSLAGVVTVTKSEDAHSGSYSAQLETMTVLGPNVSPGLVTLGNFAVDFLTGAPTFSGGIEMPDMVKNFSGWYKYSGVDSDSAYIFMMSFRHPEGEEIDTVGVGMTYLKDAADWTSFSIDMYQISENPADSFNVIIMSSPSAALHVGSMLQVDDLAIETVTGIINFTKQTTEVKVYPNPVSDFVKFEVENAEKNLEVSIFDNNGRCVEKLTFSGNSTEVNLSSYPAGMYTYQLTGENNLFGSGSFIKK
jgi:hypothetical protein